MILKWSVTHPRGGGAPFWDARGGTRPIGMAYGLAPSPFMDVGWPLATSKGHPLCYSPPLEFSFLFKKLFLILFFNKINILILLGIWAGSINTRGPISPTKAQGRDS